MELGIHNSPKVTAQDGYVEVRGMLGFAGRGIAYKSWDVML